MKNFAWLSLIATVALAGCASQRIAKDPLCDPLRAFVESVPIDQSGQLAFHTIWGTFKDEETPTLFGKRCVHNEYEPAEALCAYLVPHSSAEFAGYNVNRVLACLDKRARFERVQIGDGFFSLMYGTPDRGAHVEVTLREDIEIGGMVLRIVVHAY